MTVSDKAASGTRSRAYVKPTPAVVISGKTAASASGKDDIKINMTANAQLTEAQKPALDLIGNRGAIFHVTLMAGNQEISDLGGGVMAVTVPVPESLKDQNIAVVQIDDKGNCRKITSRTLSEGNGYFAQFSHR